MGTIMQSVARPSSAGLRGAYSDGSLYPSTEMEYSGNVVDGLGNGFGNSSPWLQKTKFNAAQNKYLQTTSSIFDDTNNRENIRLQKQRQALDDIKRQIADKEDAKRREKEEEDRLYAAMGIPSTYDAPSFQDPYAKPRINGRRASYGGEASNSYGDYGDTGAGYDAGGYGADPYGGGYGGGSYGANAYDAGGGYGGGNYEPSQSNYEQLTRGAVGGARPVRYHANMTSDERDKVNRDKAEQAHSDLQWQIQMKKQLDEEKRKKEQLEDQLFEQNMKRQQEKMKQEYEAEQDKRRKKEEEQTRRRNAQIKHVEMLQKQNEELKKSKQVRANLVADLTAEAPPMLTREDNRAIKPATSNGNNSSNSNNNNNNNQKIHKEDDDFGLNLNLKSDSRFQEARKPNKFFDNPVAPLKMAKTADDRKRPKPILSQPPGTWTHNNRNNSRTPGVPLASTSKRLPPAPAPIPVLEPQLITPAGDGGGAAPGRPPTEPPSRPSSAGVKTEKPSEPVTSEVQTKDPDTASLEVQTTFALDNWESERKHDEPRPQVVRGPQFDWKIHIDDLSEEEKKKLQHMSEDEIKQFREENNDLMSQLSAIKTDLRSARGDRQGGNDPYRNDGRGTIPSGDNNDGVDYMRLPTGRGDGSRGNTGAGGGGYGGRGSNQPRETNKNFN